MADLQTATFGTGCFWCTEAIFLMLKGVKSVVSGYSGGEDKTPTYEEVSKGDTGHAECVQVEFDPKEISFKDLLYVFWRTHDPTTLNRQGNDVGPQYRSVVFYHNESQRKVAMGSMHELESSDYYKDPIVTEITPYKFFVKAELYHQKFYSNNKNYPYCQFVIDPKIEKLKKDFKAYLKK